MKIRPIKIKAKDGKPPRFPVKEALAKVRKLIYRGNKVECPCCNKTFSLFLYSPYMSALCPYCLSFERYRLLCKYLRDETDFGSRQIRLLDIAPTWCFQEFCRSFELVDYVSIDISSPIAMRKMDICNLTFEDESFDCIICYHVLEHIKDDRKALSEIYRVMRKGGWGIIQVPIHIEKTVERRELSKEEAKEICKFPSHLRAYGRDFKQILEGAGFQVEVSDFVKKFSEDEIKRFGLDRSEELYICKK